MDFSLFVIIWIVILIVENVAGKKKKKNLPPNQPPDEKNGDTHLKIPTLANDPNFPGEDVTVFEDEVKPAEVREVGFTEMYRQRKADLGAEKISARTVESTVQNSSADVKVSNLPLNLTAESAMNAIVLSEILGKPKALQRR